jgi:tetratricopeptide (TPR) repeat protein
LVTPTTNSNATRKRRHRIANQKDYEAAIANYRKAISIKPEEAKYYGDLGNAYSKLSRNEEALDAYTQQVRFAPNDSTAHKNRGDILERLQRRDDALASYQNAVRIKPDYATKLFNAIYK